MDLAKKTKAELIEMINNLEKENKENINALNCERVKLNGMTVSYENEVKKYDSLELSKKQWVEMAEHRGEVINQLRKKIDTLGVFLAVSLIALILLIFTCAM